VHSYVEYRRYFCVDFENARVLSVAGHFSINFDNTSVLFVTHRFLVAPPLGWKTLFLGLRCSGACTGIASGIPWWCSALLLVDREGNLPSAVLPVAFWCPRLPSILHFAALWFASGKEQVRLAIFVRNSVIDTRVWFAVPLRRQ
jgi:hypothetical protein